MLVKYLNNDLSANGIMLPQRASPFHIAVAKNVSHCFGGCLLLLFIFVVSASEPKLVSHEFSDQFYPLMTIQTSCYKRLYIFLNKSDRRTKDCISL